MLDVTAPLAAQLYARQLSPDTSRYQQDQRDISRSAYSFAYIYGTPGSRDTGGDSVTYVRHHACVDEHDRHGVSLTGSLFTPPGGEHDSTPIRFAYGGMKSPALHNG